jgi:hypothetical protein
VRFVLSTIFALLTSAVVMEAITATLISSIAKNPLTDNDERKRL